MASLLSIVAALLVGLLAGWLIWGRILVNRRSAAAESAPATVVAEPVETTTAEPAAADVTADTTDAEPVAPVVADSPAEPVTVTEPYSETEPVAITETEPAAVTETEPVIEPVAVADTEPVIEPVAVADTEPVIEPVAVAETEPVAVGDTEPVAHPEPVLTAEPAAVVEATPDVEPAATEPATEPALAESAATEPALAESAVDEPAAIESAVDEPAAEPVPATVGDKLTRIEGIGPKIAATLAAAGISTYRELADTDLATLRTTIKAAKLRLSPNLATWPAQARLLAEGDQRGFTALADDLAADRAPGVEPIATTPAPAADLAAADLAAADLAPTDLAPTDLAPTDLAPTDLAPAAEPAPEPVPEPVSSVDTVPAQRTPEAAETAGPDDLTRVEGIGPKMAAALVAAGITTFAQLAVTDEAGLRAAIAAAGMRFSPSLVTWPQQAKLLADRGAVRN